MLKYPINDNNLVNIFNQIINEKIISIEQFANKYGDEINEISYFSVYLVKTADNQYILKKATSREAYNYETYLKVDSFNVPKYYGKYIENTNIYIVIEYIEGNDLSEMDDVKTYKSVDTLSAIQNKYWNASKENRYNVYYQRILKRAKAIENEPIIYKAYQLFIKRQESIPLTLSSGDFLQCNAVYSHDKVIIIDWGFGGIMPYALDIARFIAYASETKVTFPFYMNDKQKEIFVNEMYRKLNNKIDYNQYLFDIKLALLNEYVEFVEAQEDENNCYYNQASKIAKEIISNK